MEKITIEFIDRDDQTLFSGFKVSQGEKYADGLGFDEMIGLLSCMAMPTERPQLRWLKTKEQHKFFRTNYANCTSDINNPTPTTNEQH
jgi:hypothetical protein